jgi:uncharacterized protein (TIGR02118 family)
MHKLMLLFQKPDNVLEFEQSWSDAFVATAERMPGIIRVGVTRIYGSPSSEPDLHMIHEFYFEDEDALRRAMLSEEGQQTGQALLSFAADLVTIVFAEHLEEARPMVSP